MERGIAIVGSSRSGTSSVAGVLAKLGVYFGRPDQLYAPDKFNETGYWEHKALSATLRKFHLSLNLAGLDVDPIPDDWRERPMTREFTDRTVRMIRTQLAGHDLWGWKDPQASTLLPFVRSVFGEVPASPAYVICVRHPWDVASSQRLRHGTPEAQALGAWLLSTLAALRDSSGERRAVVVYEDLRREPATSIERLARALKLNPSEDVRGAAVDSVRPELAHGTTDVRPSRSYPALIERTYAVARMAAREPEKLNAGDFDSVIEGLWDRWLAWHDLFARAPFPEAMFGVSWDRAGQREVERTSYRPVRGWQTLSSTCRALPGSRVSLSIYPLPAMVWIRRASWHTEGRELDAELLPGSHGQLDEHNGIKRVWLFHGPDQVGVRAPDAPGEYTLEIDALIETGNLVAGLTFQELSRRPELA